jgi:hypothetical protein
MLTAPVSRLIATRILACLAAVGRDLAYLRRSPDLRIAGPDSACQDVMPTAHLGSSHWLDSASCLEVGRAVARLPQRRWPDYFSNRMDYLVCRDAVNLHSNATGRHALAGSIRGFWNNPRFARDIQHRLFCMVSGRSCYGV